MRKTIHLPLIVRKTIHLPLILRKNIHLPLILKKTIHLPLILRKDIHLPLILRKVIHLPLIIDSLIEFSLPDSSRDFEESYSSSSTKLMAWNEANCEENGGCEITLAITTRFGIKTIKYRYVFNNWK